MRVKSFTIVSFVYHPKTIHNLLNYKRVEVDSNLEFKIDNGAVIENDYIDDKILFTKNKEPFALYEKYEDKYKIVFKF